MRRTIPLGSKSFQHGYVVQSGRTASIDGDDGRGILRDSSVDLRHRQRRWKALGSNPSVPIPLSFWRCCTSRAGLTNIPYLWVDVVGYRSSNKIDSSTFTPVSDPFCSIKHNDGNKGVRHCHTFRLPIPPCPFSDPHSAAVRSVVKRYHTVTFSLSTRMGSLRSVQSVESRLNQSRVIRPLC